MEEIKWKKTILVKDMLLGLPKQQRSSVEGAIGILSIAIGWTKTQIKDMELSKYMTLQKEFQKRYGPDPNLDFLEPK